MRFKYTVLSIFAVIALACSTGSVRFDRVFSPSQNQVSMKSVHSTISLVTPVYADDAAPAPAPSMAPTPVDNPFSLAGDLYKAVASGNWAMAVAFAIMLALYLARMFIMPKLNITPGKWLPWLSAGLGVLGAFATNLIAGDSWWAALAHGVTVGTAASGLWALIGGKLPAAPDDKKA